MPKHKFKGKLPALSPTQLTLISWAWSKAGKKGKTPTFPSLKLRKSQSNRKVNSPSRVRCAFVCISLGIFTKIFSSFQLFGLVFLLASHFGALFICKMALCLSWALIYSHLTFTFTHTYTKSSVFHSISLQILDASLYSSQSLATSAMIAVFALFLVLIVLFSSLFIWK